MTNSKPRAAACSPSGSSIPLDAILSGKFVFALSRGDWRQEGPRIGPMDAKVPFRALSQFGPDLFSWLETSVVRVRCSRER